MAISTRRSAYSKLNTGKGINLPIRVALPSTAGTAAAAASGFLSARLAMNAIGTTYPSTLQGIPLPAPTAPLRLLMCQGGTEATTGFGAWLARFYLFGTASLTSVTSSAFTHNAATFPVTRTALSAANAPMSLIPMVWITTATATSAPVFKVNYVNQDGASVTGTKTMTLPSATTAISGGYVIRLETGDSGVRDITAVDVTTAGTTGAMSLYGVELLCPITLVATNVISLADVLSGGFAFRDLNAAVATSGTATSHLGVFTLGQTGANIDLHLNLHAVVDA
jgi:hypothetical protein